MQSVNYHFSRLLYTSSQHVMYLLFKGTKAFWNVYKCKVIWVHSISCSLHSLWLLSFLKRAVSLGLSFSVSIVCNSVYSASGLRSPQMMIPFHLFTCLSSCLLQWTVYPLQKLSTLNDRWYYFFVLSWGTVWSKVCLPSWQLTLDELKNSMKCVLQNYRTTVIWNQCSLLPSVNIRITDI